MTFVQRSYHYIIFKCFIFNNLFSIEEESHVLKNICLDVAIGKLYITCISLFTDYCTGIGRRVEIKKLFPRIFNVIAKS